MKTNKDKNKSYEIERSLYYLGKALYKYSLLKKREIKNEKGYK